MEMEGTIPLDAVSAPRNRRPRRRRHRFLRLSVWVFLAVVVFSPTINILTTQFWYLRPAAVAAVALSSLTFMYHYRLTRGGLRFAMLAFVLTPLAAISSLGFVVADIGASKAIAIILVLLVTPTIFHDYRDVLY